VAAARIVVLPGDGIGPEVTAAARRVLDAGAVQAGLQLDYVDDLVGGAAVDAYGVSLRPQTLRLCKTADAILFGAVGGPKWDDASPTSSLTSLKVRCEKARTPGRASCTVSCS